MKLSLSTALILFSLIITPAFAEAMDALGSPTGVRDGGVYLYDGKDFDFELIPGDGDRLWLFAGDDNESVAMLRFSSPYEDTYVERVLVTLAIASGVDPADVFDEWKLVGANGTVYSRLRQSDLDFFEPYDQKGAYDYYTLYFQSTGIVMAKNMAIELKLVPSFVDVLDTVENIKTDKANSAWIFPNSSMVLLKGLDQKYEFGKKPASGDGIQFQYDVLPGDNVTTYKGKQEVAAATETMTPRQKELSERIQHLTEILERLMRQAASKLGTDDSGGSTIGLYSYVRTIDKLSVRETPRASGRLLGIQPIGTFGRVIEGPVQAGGHTWWKVDYEIGRDGWSVEEWLRK